MMFLPFLSYSHWIDRFAWLCYLFADCLAITHLSDHPHYFTSVADAYYLFPEYWRVLFFCALTLISLYQSIHLFLFTPLLIHPLAIMHYIVRTKDWFFETSIKRIFFASCVCEHVILFSFISQIYSFIKCESDFGRMYMHDLYYYIWYVSEHFFFHSLTLSRFDPLHTKQGATRK